MAMPWIVRVLVTSESDGAASTTCYGKSTNPLPAIVVRNAFPRPIPVALRINSNEYDLLYSVWDFSDIATLTICDGRAHKPEHQATYSDGNWEGTVNKFASALPPMTVLINGRDEPRVVFDVGPRFENPFTQALTLTDPTPFLPSRQERGCVGRRGAWAGWGTFLYWWNARLLVSASSAEFTTDLVPVLSMTKLADASTSLSGGVEGGGGGSCFTDVLVPGEAEIRSADERRIVRRSSADNPPLIRRQAATHNEWQGARFGIMAILMNVRDGLFGGIRGTVSFQTPIPQDSPGK
ncbi:hypothetical protein B0H13DRAFT_2658540 [Mycena leptocephala]|nr:hypothetical protein B0H13DRAFT_2658540 [Mycena leptocephala]